MKDPGFKLFGKTIPMQDEEKLKKFHQTSSKSIVTCTQENEKSTVKQVDSVIEVEDQNSNDSQGSQPCEDDNNCKETKSELEKEKSEDAKVDSNEADEKTPENEDKAPKKPDKLLPCPRCDSLDTKFCYYNNYNVNQPRHFCKNCQRYWTAGGTMRNVPVGAGRRKNKNSSSHYRHMMMADGIAATRADVHEAVHHHVMPGAISSSSGRVVKASQLQLLPLDVESGGTVLNFGPDAPLCESMANALNLTDHTLMARKIIKVKDEDRAGENKDDASCGSSVTASTSADKDGFKGYEGVTNRGEYGGMMGWPNGITPQQQQFYGACPWMYGWNVGWSGCPPTPQGCYSNGIVHPNVEENNTNGNGVTLNPANSSSTGPTPPAAMWATGIPWPFIPGTYWPGAGAWVGGSWNMPFSPLPSVASTASKAVSSSPSSSAGNSGNSGSPTLGKHCRENAQSEDKPDGCLWVPKTLRIDDPSEAAKSSIWTTLGIGSKSESISAGGIFKAFQPKSEERDSIKVSSQGLHANPAALSRSMAFQESAT